MSEDAEDTSGETSADVADEVDEELDDLEPEESDDPVMGGAIKGAPQTIVNYGR